MPLRYGLIGTGWIGRFHAESLAHRVSDATLDDADGAIAAAAEVVVALQVGFNRRFAAVFADAHQAVYGYDLRGEVFGSGGVLLAGRAPADAGRLNTELFADAYVAQFAHFVDSIHQGTPPSVTGHGARIALEIALAAAQSVRTGRPVTLAAVPA